MKGIILQHYNGKMGELEKLSSENMQQYAEKCGVEYKLLRGILKPGLSNQSQKIAMLDEEWDEYDVVVMMDIDMFTRRGQERNIFTEETGIGRNYGIQPKLVKSLERKFPFLADKRYAYWGGSIYRTTREIRQLLRSNFRMNEAVQFSNNFNDEGIMHRLAVLAEIKNDRKYYLDGQQWNYSSFDEGVENAEIIHIRPKRVQGGKKYPKIENYNYLVEKNII